MLALERMLALTNLPTGNIASDHFLSIQQSKVVQIFDKTAVEMEKDYIIAFVGKPFAGFTNMTPSIDITATRGDTRRHTFIIRVNDGNDALDISAWSSFVLAVNRDSEPTDTTDEIGRLVGHFVTDGSDGMVYFIPPGNWEVESYYYDAQALDGNGEKITFVKGKYKITQDVTKG